MKQLGSFVSKVVICGVALSAVTLAVSARAEAKQGRATVQEVRGTADYSTGGGAFTALTTGARLDAGTVIRTAAGSEVSLFLAQNGPVAVVRADTLLGLDRLSYDKTGAETVIDTRLDLKSGRVSGHVRKLAAASKYEVKIPNGVVSIKTAGAGTDYDIEVPGRTTVANGTATMVYNNVNYSINSGQTFDPTIPGVRPATPPEIDGTKVPAVKPTVVAEVKPPEEFFVSPLVGGGAGRSEGGSDNGSDRGE